MVITSDYPLNLKLKTITFCEKHFRPGEIETSQIQGTTLYISFRHFHVPSKQNKTKQSLKKQLFLVNRDLVATYWIY